MEGKIIAVIGAPASGKSTLVRKLGKKLKARIFLEGEEKHLPGYIRENIAENKNGFQTILYFHNQAIKQYLEALNLKKKGKTVILDTFWISNVFYLDTMLNNKDERRLFLNLINMTKRILPLPDIVIYIQIKDETIKRRLVKRGRTFEKYFFGSAVMVNKDHSKYLRMTGKSKIFKVKSENININNILKHINQKRSVQQLVK